MSAGGKGPYIQVALEALSLYPRVAMMAGIDIAHVHMGFNELWCHCFRAKVDHIPRALLAGFFPETPRLLETLVACGFVEPAEDGLLRVRGIEGRYNPTSSKAEAGRKGGLKTAAKAVREGGRFVKQPSSDQAERQAAAKHEESPGSPSTAKHTKQEPGREPIKSQADGATKLAPSSSREPSRTPSTTPSSGQAGQAEHQALNPKCSLSSSLSSPLRGESNNALGSAAPPSRASRVDLSAEGPHGLTPPPVWPNAECEAAGVVWFEHVSKAWPSGSCLLDDAKRAAQAYPDNFVAAVRAALAQGLDLAADPVRQLHATCQGLAIAGHGPTQPKHGPPPPSWPGPRSEPASRRFMASATANARLSGPSAMLTPHGFADLAREFGDECFDAAVEACIAEGPEWPGWGVKNPLNWLRTQCEDQRFQAKRRSAKQAPGDRYTPRFRPERGVEKPVSAKASEPARRPAPPPLGRVMPSTPASELWKRALVTLREFLEPVEFRQYVEPLSLGGLSDGGELVLWCRDEAMRQELDDGIRGFVEGALIAAAREAEGWPEGPPIVRFAAVSEVAA